MDRLLKMNAIQVVTSCRLPSEVVKLRGRHAVGGIYKTFWSEYFFIRDLLHVM